VNLRKGCHQIDGGSKISSKLIRKSDPKKEEALINPTFSTASANSGLNQNSLDAADVDLACCIHESESPLSSQLSLLWHPRKAQAISQLGPIFFVHKHQASTQFLEGDVRL
jgi:hypothetical protein